MNFIKLSVYSAIFSMFLCACSTNNNSSSVLYTKTREEKVEEKVNEYLNQLENIDSDSLMLVGSSFEKWDDCESDIVFENNIVNFGIDFSFTSDWDNSIYEELVLPKKPSVILLSLGLNEICANYTVKYTFAAIEKFVEKISKDLEEVKIVMVENHPIDTSIEILNNIKELNSLFKNLVDTIPQVYGCISSWQDFYNDINEQSLNPNYFDADGVYLNSNGYEILKNNINSNLSKLLNKPQTIGTLEDDGTIWGDII